MVTIVKMTTDESAQATPRAPRKMRLPGFVTEEEIGLGDVIKRATSAVGIRPCGPCGQRAAAMNQWLRFSGKRPR